MKLLENFRNWLLRLPIIERTGIQLLVGLIISLILLGIFAAIAEDVVEQDKIVAFDLQVANALHASATPTSNSIFRALSWIGMPGLWIPAIGVGIYFLIRREWLNLGVWIVALLGGLLLMQGLKFLFARPRPVFVSPIVVEQNFSFPSGHATLSLIGFGLLAFFIRRSTTSQPLRILVTVAAILLILGIGISRLTLGVHFVSDVAAGFAVGGVWLTACITALDTVYYRRNRHAAAEGVPHP